MDKQKILEQAYDSAFNDELEKNALNLRGFKKVQKAVSKKLIRGGAPALDISSVKNFNDILSGKLKAKFSREIKGAYSSPKLHSLSKNIPKNMSGKVFTGKGGGIGVFGKKSILGNAVKLPKSPRQKEVVNRIFSTHEMLELGTKKKNVGEVFSHISPKILIDESNMISSLPKRYKPAGNFMKKLRSASGENMFLEYYLPKGFKYGEGRISKATRKNVMKRFLKEVKESSNKV